MKSKQKKNNDLGKKQKSQFNNEGTRSKELKKEI